MNTPKDRQHWVLKFIEKKPAASFKECFSKYSVIYKMSEQTFSKDWKKANAKYLEQRKDVEKKRIEALTNLEVDAVKGGVLTVLEAQMILTKIARGEVEEIDEEKIIPAHKDRITAISELGKMLRWQQVQQVLNVENMQVNNNTTNNLKIDDAFFGNFIIEVDERKRE
jgi:hypothetical protein